MSSERPVFGKKAPEIKERESKKAEVRKRACLAQPDFLGDGLAEFDKPRYIADTVPGKLVVLMAEEQKIESTLRKLGLYADATKGDGQIEEITPGTGQLRRYKDFPGRKAKKHEAAFIVTPPLGEETGSGLSKILGVITSILKPDSPVYVVEKRNSKVKPDRKRRDDILNEAGLVDRTILTGKGDKIVWRSRTRRPFPEREGVDITNKENKWYQSARSMWGEMAREYRRQGCTVVDPQNSEILERLKDSKNILDDLRSLRHGIGVVIREENTGRYYKIDMQGVKTEIFPNKIRPDKPVDRFREK